MTRRSAVDEVLAGGGACGELLRQVDWAKTPVGPVEGWPQSLRTAVGIVLASNYPLYLAWGPHYVQMYNDAYRPICGATKHPASLGQEASLTWPEVWADVLGPSWERMRVTGEPIRVENLLMLLDRNGYLEECYFSYCHSPIRDETGGMGGVFAALTETTEQVINERRLRVIRDLSTLTGEQATARDACREAARVLASCPNDVPFALLYLLDAEGEAHLVGTSGVEAGGAAAPRSVPSGEDSPDTWPLAAVVRGGEPLLLSAPRLPRALGPLPAGPWPEGASTVWLQPITQSGHARPVGVLVTGLSPRRAFDEHYRDFLVLAARTVSTSVSGARAREEERRRAEALEQLDRAKTAFFNNISHEFRTPLALMLGPSRDSLDDSSEPLGPHQRERQETIHRNGLRLLKLVNTLLDFSRIEAGRVQAAYAPTDLAALTEGLASTFRSMMERAGLRLVVDCPPLPEPIWVDREMWEKIVLNLLSNAFKFTFEGEVRVALRGFAGRVVLSVSDTGVGIPAEELPRVFERFHRVRGTRGRSFEGSGIGLSLVQELVKLHGGDIQVGSRVGRGSTFTVSVPTGNAHLPAEHRMLEPPSVSLGPSVAAFLNDVEGWLGGSPVGERATPPLAHPGGTDGHVLLVDDNADMRAYVRRLLEGRYTVETAENGREALNAILRRVPDLVLSDVMMPGLDGFGLLRRLREAPRTRGVPVILLSARAGEEATVEGLRHGANDYLVKPFSARELLARVEGNIAAARAREEKRQAERERGKLAALVEQSSDFIGMGDLQGLALYINDAGRRLVGLRDEDDVRRTHLLDFFTEEDRPFVRDHILPAVAKHGRWEGEFRFRHFVTGEAIPVLYHFFQLTDAETGEPVGIATVTRDISERKRRELEAQRRAEFEKQLIGIVSHDLRNPINAILLSAQTLLRRDELSGPAMKNATRIVSSAERATRLIRDLLDFTQARLGSGIPIRREPMNFHDTIWQALEEVQLAHPERRVLFERAGDGQGEWDGERLHQVVQNLVTNALRYSPPETSVRVSTLADGVTAVLQVHNHGPPISEELLPRLFQAMQRGALEPDFASRSVGLGLFIVQQVVHAHGGQVDVRSTAAEGTTFTVRMPCRAVSPPERSRELVGA
ncbi:ATP-binding protein [Melittangium boletus]|uniref:histidine kinase n=1 Tax=Melittangium boletus DSM 14713 TaxID=1294270 RepID=A0A250IGZ2_9BACT|nr:ATP-binding protein [Melittangium boletus]ATB30490.1 two-component system sensor histidine kinase/response regulator [Melittangium boletus DSM 14713]